MHCTASSFQRTHARCLRSLCLCGRKRLILRHKPLLRTFFTLGRSLRSVIEENLGEVGDADAHRPSIPTELSHNGATTSVEPGAMSRRLQQMTDQSLDDSGVRASKTIDEGGFSEELKKKLESRIAESIIRTENVQAFAQVDMPTSAGKGTVDVALAQPWSGFETTQDTVLRMLVDKHKPLKRARSTKAPTPRGDPINVDLARRPSRRSSGERLANARDRSSTYALAKDITVSEKDREQMRKELKERFSPGARHIPASVQGLSSLANERIEDAIARGQFKNLPRGKKLERDYQASSPFIDTTEYLMNKMVKRQDIVPPWIEKQQQLSKEVNAFRRRLRSEWRRHAARSIASKGGTLHEQIAKANSYAAAELIANPKAGSTERLQEDSTEIVATLDKEEPVKPLEGVDSSSPRQPSSTKQPADQMAFPQDSNPLPISSPFRDSTWEKTEHSYHTLSITSINNLTRSYNLMAPELAKKPYYNLSRELQACYADVAPQLASKIRERARAPVIRVERVGHTPGGIMERFGGSKAKVWDERRPQYGFKEFWKDLWGSSIGSRAN